MQPYRGGPARDSRAPAPEADGIVDALIHQFADPFAFYRELVQNSVDAGASSIAIALSWEPGDGTGMVSIAVRDDGCGMDQEILEEQLTVLFRSTKDKDDSKIGKFGIGFVSVLAVDPKLVAVRTSQGRGVEWTLHLARDQTYELFRAEGGSARGTTVTLHVALAREALETFVENSERALEKWCRHIEIPVRFVAHVAGAPAPMRELRVDTPFGLRAHATVDATHGETRVVAGLPLDGQPYLAFFNRGLLLYETSQELLGAVAVKILDPALEHTLSRDNVRRDEHFERAMRFARGVIDEQLTTRAKELMREVAHRRIDEPPIDVLHDAIVAAGLGVTDADLFFPVLHAEKPISARKLKKQKRLWAAAEGCAITESVSRDGVVLDVSAAARRDRYLATLMAYAGRPIEDARGTLTLASDVELSPSDQLLLDRVAALLDALGPAPSDLRLVSLRGAAQHATAITGAGQPPRVLTADEIARDPFALLGRPPLWLRSDAPLVSAARARAEREPEVAAAILARAILIDRAALDEAGDDAWLEHALARISP